MPQNRTRSDLRRPENQKFPGGACPQIPLACALRACVRLPRTVLSSQFPRRTSANELPTPLTLYLDPTYMALQNTECVLERERRTLIRQLHVCLLCLCDYVQCLKQLHILTAT